MLNIKDINVYIGKKKIIKNTSFQVNSGEIIGLIGPNGAGKTTIMKTILGLTKFTGNISINGKEITENNHNSLSEVGALIEHPAIYPFLTGLQNLEIYSHDEKDMLNIISMLRMNNYIDNKAKGYSLGMKQKLGIAIALLNNPKLVILDEPMNGLDVEATIEVRKIIQQFAKQGTAFLISSHVLSELQKVMTQIVMINNGEVIVNQEITEFNKTNNQNYKVSTEDNALVLELLNSNNISVSKTDEYLLVKTEDIYKVQDILNQSRVYLNELSPANANFEEIIVNILEKQRSK